MSYVFQWRRGSAAEWAAANPILRDGEPGLETDTEKFKIGDGVNPWSDLVYYLDENSVTALVQGWTEPGKGDQGDPGPATVLSIGDVVTAPAGENASATIDGVSPNQEISFVIPRGDKGNPGDKGDTGPANSLSVGDVTTLPAGSPAAATITGDAPSQELNLDIPAGEPGIVGGVTPPSDLTKIWNDPNGVSEESDRVAIGDELTVSVTSGAANAGLVPVADGLGSIDWAKVDMANVTGLTEALDAEDVARTAAHNALVAEFEAHEADSTNVHGIADMALLETKSDAAQKIVDHLNAVDPHAQYETSLEAAAKITAHEVASNPHPAYLKKAVVAQTGAPADTSVVWLDTDETPFTAAAEVHAARHASGGADPVTLAQSQITGLTAAIAALAPLASPVLTGNPTAPTPASGDNDTSIATTAFVTGYAAAKATVGNLLTDNQASGTDALGTTAGFSTEFATVASSTAQAASGTRSLEITSTRTGSYDATFGVTGLVVGAVYTFTAKVKNGVGTRTYRTDVNATTKVPETATTATTWTRSSVTFIANSTTHYIYITSVSSGAIGDSFYADEIGFWLGAGGDWAMPGTPITNLGTKVSHPNVDDVLVQRWDEGLGRWQTAHYDSGWRNISHADAGSPTGYATSGWLLRIRRIGTAIHWRWAASTTATWTTADTIAWPTGFAPASWWTGQAVGRNSSSGNNGVLIRATGTVVYPWQNMAASQGFLDGIPGTHVTDAAIPTSLPGTLVSAAPA